MATAASSPRRISLAEEALVLPARNPGLFALVSVLIFVHTFLFLSAALLRAHPLAAAITDKLMSNTADHAAAATDDVWGRGEEPALLYLAYLASKLATQAAAVLAACATHSGDLVLRRKPTEGSMVLRARPFFFAITAACTAAAVELAAAAALLLALTPSTSSLPILGCVLLLLCLGALLPATIAAAAAAAEESRGVREAWRLVATRRGEAAVQAVAASLLPVAVYPAYALALEFGRSSAAVSPTYVSEVGESVWALGVLYACLLPPVGVQLYSAVAATVFYRRCREEHRRHASACHVPLVAVTVKQ